MIAQEEMKAVGGVVCLHCGTLRIKQGEQCLAVTTGRGGIGYIALAHKDQHPLTAGWTPPAPPAPTP